MKFCSKNFSYENYLKITRIVINHGKTKIN